jgi:N-carbamoylputrescine amidase
MRPVTLAATQMACSWDIDDNIARGEGLVRQAAESGAQMILLQELFETPYFCIEQDPVHFAMAREASQSRVVQHFSALAAELGVVLPISFFERAGPAFFNALVVADADGSLLGRYRKTHIPQNPGYEEKFYFSPGDSGFRVFDTRFGRLGCGICWDQWFPETVRCLALAGAEVVMFPTAIGSEPEDPKIDSAGHWQRVMQGHAAANILPVVASNRIGLERGTRSEITFYGSSFIADHTGALLAEADRVSEAVVTAIVDLDAIARHRATWGVFRDRRPDRYEPTRTLDGRQGEQA